MEEKYLIYVYGFECLYFLLLKIVFFLVFPFFLVFIPYLLAKHRVVVTYIAKGEMCSVAKHCPRVSHRAVVDAKGFDYHTLRMDTYFFLLLLIHSMAGLRLVWIMSRDHLRASLRPAEELICINF